MTSDRAPEQDLADPRGRWPCWGRAWALVQRVSSAVVEARGEAALGDRTLLDGLDAVCSSLRQSVTAGVGLGEALHLAAIAALVAADKTRDMEPKVGHASWVPRRAARALGRRRAMLAIAMRAAAGWSAAGACSRPVAERRSGVGITLFRALLAALPWPSGAAATARYTAPAARSNRSAAGATTPPILGR